MNCNNQDGDNSVCENGICVDCQVKNDLLNHYTEKVLQNEMTLRRALEEIYMAGMEQGYDDCLLDDLESKEILLAVRNGFVLEEE